MGFIAPGVSNGKRKTFSREFKLEAVRQLERGTKPASDLAMERGIRRNLRYERQEALRQNLPVNLTNLHELTRCWLT